MLMPFKLMPDLMCLVSDLDIRVTKMLTAPAGIIVGVCVCSQWCSYVVLVLVENFFGKLGLKREVFHQNDYFHLCDTNHHTNNNYGLFKNGMFDTTFYCRSMSLPCIWQIIKLIRMIFQHIPARLLL